MARQRKYLAAALAAVLALLAGRACLAATPDILTPTPFAVELASDATTLSVGNLPIRDLLARTQAGGDRVTLELPRERVGPGAWRVILSAWDPEIRDRPVARREAVLLVLPHGMTPVGATGVGGGPRIARDDAGFVHMLWTDGWRAGPREGAMYRRGRVLPDGGVQLDGEILDLSRQHPGNFTASPAMAVAGDRVDFIWQAEATVWYRSLHKAGDAWNWSDEVDTKAQAREVGPAIAADATAVHVLTSDGHYLTTRDGGRAWRTETVPFGAFARIGSVSLTTDASGRPLAAASVLIGDAGGPGVQSQAAQGRGERWTLRLAKRIGDGAWQALPGPVDGRPEWASPDRPEQDVTCTSFQVREDASGAMYATWDGAPAGRPEHEFQAFYAWRPPGGGWGPPIVLAAPDPIHGLGKSFTGGLILDGDAAMPVVSLGLHSGWRYRGFDTELELFRGSSLRAPAQPLTGFIRDAMTANEPAEALSTDAAFPAATLLHSGDGRLWADILMTIDATRAASAGVIVWRHLDVADWRRAVGQ